MKKEFLYFILLTVLVASSCKRTPDCEENTWFNYQEMDNGGLEGSAKLKVSGCDAEDVFFWENTYDHATYTMELLSHEGDGKARLTFENSQGETVFEKTVPRPRSSNTIEKEGVAYTFEPGTLTGKIELQDFKGELKFTIAPHDKEGE